MRRLSADAFLLDVVDLHDQDSIVTFLTSEHGRKRGVARSARRKFSRFAGQLQLLSRASVRWFEKDDRDLVRVESVELVQPAAVLADLEGIALGSYLADHLVQFTQENEDCGPFCRLLESTLDGLAAGIDRDLAIRYFEIWVLRLAGIFPVPRECPICNRDLAEGGSALAPEEDAILCGDCGAGGLRIDDPVLRLLRRSGAEAPQEMDRDRPAPLALRRTEELCGRVRRAFLGHELRSYRVMRQLLSVPDTGPPGGEEVRP